MNLITISFKFTSTETSADDTLLYIANYLSLLFRPLCFEPTRITRHSNTLIYIIFSNVTDSDIISGNLTATISDYLPQFAIIFNMFGNISGIRFNIYERDW